MFKLIEKTVGLRVSREEELEGLDYTEHRASAYPDFQVASRVWAPADAGGTPPDGEKKVGELSRTANQPAI
jgi:Amt family ammonium transporter